MLFNIYHYKEILISFMRSQTFHSIFLFLTFSMITMTLDLIIHTQTIIMCIKQISMIKISNNRNGIGNMFNLL